MTGQPPNGQIAAADDAQAAAVITHWYDLIDRRRTDEACLLFLDDIEWIEPEGSPCGTPGSASSA